MSKFKLMVGQEIETEGKTIAEVICEALEGIPVTGTDLKGIVLDFAYATTVDKFKRTLSPQQQDEFYKIERLQEQINNNKIEEISNHLMSRAYKLYTEWVAKYEKKESNDKLELALFIYEKAYEDIKRCNQYF